MFRALIVTALVALTGCPHKAIVRPYPAPPAADVVGQVTRRGEIASSLKAETKTDVRMGKERANVTVYILAAPGGKLRFQALNPNDSLAADLASDGARFCFLDTRANCGDCGPATPENVARLIRIPLQPDEVVTVLMGGAPLLPDPTPEVTWDDEDGREILALEADGWKQKVILDGKDKRWDLLLAELHDPKGKLAWRVRHKDFRAVKTKSGETVRLPAASLFEQAGDTVKIEWREQSIGETLDAGKFQIELQEGLPACGQ
jgi:hypothetical protein